VWTCKEMLIGFVFLKVDFLEKCIDEIFWFLLVGSQLSAFQKNILEGFKVKKMKFST